MGKLITYLSILIVAEILFLITGQLGTNSVGSIIFNAILNINTLSLQQVFTQAIGQFDQLFGSNTGFAALVLGGTVTLGTLFTKSDSVLFIPVGFTLAILLLDFTFIFVYLQSLNFVLATVIMGPLAIIYTFTVLEWVRAKD